MPKPNLQLYIQCKMGNHPNGVIVLVVVVIVMELVDRYVVILKE